MIGLAKIISFALVLTSALADKCTKVESLDNIFVLRTPMRVGDWFELDAGKIQKFIGVTRFESHSDQHRHPYKRGAITLALEVHDGPPRSIVLSSTTQRFGRHFLFKVLTLVNPKSKTNAHEEFGYYLMPNEGDCEIDVADDTVFEEMSSGAWELGPKK